LFFVTASVAYADMVNYSLDNVILDDGTQMHGTFTLTFNTGDFEGFHTGVFLGGRIALDTGAEVVFEDGFETK
jgi:hypothetical protein